MLTIMTTEARRAAKQQLLADLQDGYSVPETRARASLPWHPATIYRLRQRLQADPALALADGRHGHPVKLRGEVRDWMVASARRGRTRPAMWYKRPSRSVLGCWSVSANSIASERL
jgi:hypothetical protein